MNGRPPVNSRGEIQVALPRRHARKDRKKTPPTLNNQDVQKALNAIERDYHARKRWWAHALASDPAKRAEKLRIIRQRLESIQGIRIHIARTESKCGIQTHPETPR